jgi:hypothetical protein
VDAVGFIVGTAVEDWPRRGEEDGSPASAEEIPRRQVGLARPAPAVPRQADRDIEGDDLSPRESLLQLDERVDQEGVLEPTIYENYRDPAAARHIRSYHDVHTVSLA